MHYAEAVRQYEEKMAKHREFDAKADEAAKAGIRKLVKAYSQKSIKYYKAAEELDRQYRIVAQKLREKRAAEGAIEVEDQTANLRAWHEQADMPTVRSGMWVDLETGIAYDPTYDYIKQRPAGQRSKPTPVSDKALAAREEAKKLGGCALKGTKKQKEWAEKIRAEKLEQMTEAQRVLAVDPAGLLAHSKFWIENRDRSGKEIGAFVEEQKALLAQFNAAKSKEDREPIAKQYNALTDKWGV